MMPEQELEIDSASGLPIIDMNIDDDPRNARWIQIVDAESGHPQYPVKGSSKSTDEVEFVPVASK